MSKKQQPYREKPSDFDNTKPSAKVVLIKGADKSLLGPESIVTDKESELDWNKHPTKLKPGQ